MNSTLIRPLSVHILFVISAGPDIIYHSIRLDTLSSFSFQDMGAVYTSFALPESSFTFPHSCFRQQAVTCVADISRFLCRLLSSGIQSVGSPGLPAPPTLSPCLPSLAPPPLPALCLSSSLHLSCRLPIFLLPGFHKDHIKETLGWENIQVKSSHTKQSEANRKPTGSGQWVMMKSWYATASQ